MRKLLITLLLIISATNFCSAQFYKSVLPSPEFSNALEKIVLDFRINFSSIQGASLVNQGEAETYESIVKLPGSLECFIYKYRSKADTSASWQAVMYKGDDFKEASKTYENVFKLVKKSRVKWIDRTMVGFSGELEKPAETLKFTVSTLQFDLDDKRYKNFQADVELLSSYSGWEVHLNLQSKRPDDAEN